MRILIHDYFSSLTPHVGPNVGVIHFFEPVGGGAEWALIVNHREAKVGVIEVEIKGDTPHHNQSDGELNNLPGDGATGAPKHLSAHS